MKKIILVLSVLLSLSLNNTQAQCPVSAKANVVNIQCGDTVLLNALATAGDYVINNNFNAPTQRPGAEWEASASATYTNPCGPPIAGGLTYLWMGAAADVPRELRSIPFDLTTGGYIKFDMRYAIQGQNSPCEGIDLPNEGVFLQYSVGGGGWTTIDYINPNGGTDPFRTNWNTYQYTLPAGACNPGTRVRWFQESSSGIGTDHWGLDNIQIVRNDPSFRFDWKHDLTDPTTTGATSPVVPFTDTTFYVTYYRQGGTLPTDTCLAQVSINTVLPTGVISANPTQVCPPATSQLDIIASFIPPLPAVCGLSGSGCVGVSSQFTLGTTAIAEPLTGGYSMFGRSGTVGPVTSCNCVNGDGNCDNSGRTQFIIRASEFPALFKGGQIYSLDLSTLGFTQGSDYHNLTISIGCTNKSEFASNTDFETGLVQVFNPKDVNFITGWNTLLFDNAYDWPGTGNIVIQVCWNMRNDGAFAVYRTGNIQKMATTEFSTINARGCGGRGCAETAGATRYQNRPFVRLGYCYRPIPNLTYNWTPAPNLNNATIKNPIATTFSTTNYTVVVSDAKRPKCNLTKSISVSVVAPVVAVSPRSTILCSSGTSVPISATATPSTSGGTITSYSWQPTTGLSNPNIANPTASPSVTTTYKCFVTDNTGCIGVDSLTITINPTSNATATNNGPICEGQTLSLSTPNLPGATYSWSGPNSANFSTLRTPSIANVDSSHAGTYSVSVTLPGCTPTVGTTSVSITKKGNPTVNYGTGTFCKTGSNPVPTTSEIGTFSANSPNLKFASTSSGEINLATSLVGNYIITFTPNSVACTGPISFPVSIVNSFIANFTYPLPKCVGLTDTLKPLFNNGGTPGNFSVVSGNAANLVFISANSGFIDLKKSKAGQYTVRNFLPASSGCSSAQYDFTFDLNDGPTAVWNGLNEGDQFCKNVSSVKVLTPLQTGGTFTGSGVYKDTDNKFKFNPTLANGDTAFIKYNISNASGCKDSLLKKVLLNTPPKPVIQGPDSICTGQTVGLSHNETGASYLWSPGGQTSRFLNDFPTSNRQYILTITSAENCIGKDTFNVGVKPKPSPIISGDFIICDGESTILTASGADNYVWDKGATTNSSYNVSPSTTTTYSLIGAFSNGCIDSTKQTVTVNPIPVVDLNDFSNICENGTPISLNGGTPSGGQYIINGVANSTNFNPSTYGAGTHEINYQFTDGNGCSSNKAKNIIVLAIPARPKVNFVGTPCIGNSLKLSTPSVSNATYLWSGPEFTANPGLDVTLREPTINPLSAGSAGLYQVSITINNCTSNPGDSTLVVHLNPSVSISPTNPFICEDGAATLTARDNNNLTITRWLWTTTDPNGVLNPNGTSVQVLPRSAVGNYVVTATSSNGCIGTANTSVNLIYYPIVNLGQDKVVCIGDAVNLSSTTTYPDGFTYNWYPQIYIPNSTSATQQFDAVVKDSLIYHLEVSDRGCSSEDSILLVINDCSLVPVIQIPNAFSPNGDNENEKFNPLKEKLATFELQIYNRWGQMLFSTTDQNEGWDGRINGEEAQEGVYIYLVKATDLLGKPIKRMGTVALLK